MLRIYVGEKLLEFSDQDLERMYLDEGKEGKVYRYKGEVLKIHHDEPKKGYLDEEDSIRFSEISTKRLLLPKRMIYADDKIIFKGYTTTYIDKKDPRTIIDTNMGAFLEELDIINEDLITLASNNAYVEDFHRKNFLYNGNFYMGDPGSYTFVDGRTFKDLYKRNTYKLSLFMFHLISHSMDMELEDFIVLSESFNYYDYIGDQMRKTAKSDETVEQYVKRIVY